MTDLRITTPNQGEEVISEWVTQDVFVTELPADPIALRISIGRATTGAAVGLAYFVFRGPEKDIAALLHAALDALTKRP